MCRVEKVREGISEDKILRLRARDELDELSQG